MSRRRRVRSRFARLRWPTRLFAMTVLAIAGYFGKDSFRELGLPNLGESRVPSDPPGSVVARRAPEYPAANDETVVVERVVDGDTLVVTGGDRIRLIGVDTPETHHPTRPAQPFGQEAFEFTRRMTEGREVVLRFDPGEHKDRYGRTLAYVYVNGQFLNETLISVGLARALTNYPFSSQMKSRFRAAEAQAKAQKRGVWSLPHSPFDVTSQPTGKRAG